MTQPVIFISYSHRDEKEKDRLLSHLGVLQHQGLIDLWSDDRIGAGADWKQEIKEAMAQAKVAILLISANFLTSDFILGEEVPSLLKRRKSEGLTIFPVIAKACAWQEVNWLTRMNVRPKNGRPIWGASRHRVDEDLAAIAKEVADVVKTDPHITPTTSDIYGKSEETENIVPKQRVQAYLQGDFSSLSIDRKSAAIDAFAAIMGISPQAIEVYRVYEGSIVFDLGIPPDAARRLRSRLEANDVQLRLLKVEKVLLEIEPGKIEKWIIKEGEFDLVISTHSTVSSGGYRKSERASSINSKRKESRGNSMSRKRNFWSRLPPSVQVAIITGVIALITAVIAVCGGIVVAVIGLDRIWEIVLGPTTPNPTTATVAVHVADKDNGTSIPRARVLLFFKGERLIEDTDTTGTSQFLIPLSGEAVNTSVVVEANNYKVERFDGIKFQEDDRVDVHLSKQEGTEANVIVLVSDDNEEPLSGVNVVLLVEGNPHIQLTDSNGIAQIPLIFPDKQIGAEIQLSASDFETSRRNVTLLPNTIVPIRLNRKTNAIDIAELPTPSLGANTPTPREPTNGAAAPSMQETSVALQNTTSQIPGIEVQLTEFSRFENTITVRLRFNNSGTEDQGVWVTNGSYLRNDSTQETYRLVDQSNSLSANIPAQGSLEVWAKYEVPADTTAQNLTLVVGNGVLFEHLQMPTPVNPTSLELLPIQSTSQIPGIEVQLTEFSRFENTITVRLRFNNSGTEDQGVWVTNGSYLRNDSTQETYRLVDQSNALSANIPAQGSLEVWAKYEVPADTTAQNLTLVVGNGVLFEHLQMP